MSANTRLAAQPEPLLQRLDWSIIRRLDGLLQGDYRTLFYGSGLDFADLREYHPQDDVRHIDWNVTARMDRPYVRQFVEDREVTAWFLLDLSRSMAFGPVERPKEVVLLELVGVLARLLTRSGNRVGVIVFDNHTVRTIPPRTGRNQVLRIMRELINRMDNATTATTDLGTLLAAAQNTIKRRSLLFVISDFISQPGWERRLAQLGQRHEMIAIRLWDKHEIELPNIGMIVVEDAETGQQITVDTSNQIFRRRFAEVVAQREADLTTTFQQARVAPFELATHEDLVTALVKMAGLRKRQRMYGRDGLAS